MNEVVDDSKIFFLAEQMLEFVRAAVLDSELNISSDATIDWDGLMDIASEHGLLAWVWDGICKLPDNHQPNRQHRINWGLSAQEIWDNYYHKQKVLDKIVHICSENGVRVLLLKGQSLSTLYPKPESRPSGDIDIYLFNDAIRGVELLSQGKYELSGKHYVFTIDNVMVECHEKLIDQGTNFQKQVETYLESTLDEAILCEGGFYVLSRWSNLIHTLLHILAHLNNPGPDPLTIRSILDYAMMLNRIVQDGLTQDYLIIVKELRLKKASDLFVRFSEWILQKDFSRLYSGDAENDDVEKVRQLLFRNEIRYPMFDQHSYLKQLCQRIDYYKKNRWRFSYLPSLERFRFSEEVRLQSHIFIKYIFGLPFNKPFGDSIHGLDKRHD